MSEDKKYENNFKDADKWTDAPFGIDYKNILGSFPKQGIIADVDTKFDDLERKRIGEIIMCHFLLNQRFILTKE